MSRTPKKEVWPPPTAPPSRFNGGPGECRAHPLYGPLYRFDPITYPVSVPGTNDSPSLPPQTDHPDSDGGGKRGGSRR
ncbi:hypothetical protein Pla108_27030 [Botrimarina colliarenosi]|uniref:Uncharacterized protein n=1 Tax=Botrimarina colliarenosi TaxID=2528001 RepID=A0A5C6AC08_9BACT|nr:hypothetical protein Pla108_27030 [Botrimarina colliarenosi]